MTDSSVPDDIDHEEPGTGIRARMELWRVGGLDLFATRNSGFELHRMPRHVCRQRSRPVVPVSLQRRGVGRAEVAGQQQAFGPDDICISHELTPRVHGWSGDGAAQAVAFGMDRLGLPVDAVLKAAFQPRASPLHDMVLRHLRGLWQGPGRLAADPGATAPVGATTDLVRALLNSAAHDERAPLVRSVMDDTLLARAWPMCAITSPIPA